ncbi:MAG: hypothetical protein V1825_00655 [Candidatus Falkowbacteria bacterium]|nr:hypothetical protein [Candidatus Parcubacteria bacterium]
MFKAISGALSFLLIILVLRMALPQIADLLAEIIVQFLTIVKNGLSSAGGQFI